MAEKKKEVAQSSELEVEKVSTKADVQEFLDSIARKCVDSETSYMHAMLALNTLLRLPNANELFDEKLKSQAKDLWTKVKSTGLQLIDPPLLFGLPKGDGEVKRK